MRGTPSVHADIRFGTAHLPDADSAGEKKRLGDDMATKDFESVKAMVAALQPSYPVYCLRPEVIAETAKRFLDLFPGRVLYAVKRNPHPEVLKALYKAGIRHFDTASLPEIAQVRESFADAACYFMHPVKGRAVINTSARVYEIDTFVIDHLDEL